VQFADSAYTKEQLNVALGPGGTHKLPNEMLAPYPEEVEKSLVESRRQLQGAHAQAHGQVGGTKDSMPLGFMIGGHGMSDCGQYGFAYIDSQAAVAGSATPRFRVWYFEEFRERFIPEASTSMLSAKMGNRKLSSNTNGERHNYEDILECLTAGNGKTQGIAGCTHLATAWLDLQLGSGRTYDENNKRVTQASAEQTVFA